MIPTRHVKITNHHHDSENHIYRTLPTLTSPEIIGLYNSSPIPRWHNTNTAPRHTIPIRSPRKYQHHDNNTIRSPFLNTVRIKSTKMRLISKRPPKPQKHHNRLHPAQASNKKPRRYQTHSTSYSQQQTQNTPPRTSDTTPSYKSPDHRQISERWLLINSHTRPLQQATPL